jgi:hypothetical protein
MKIISLRKIKVGDGYPVIRVKYKTLFGTKQRDAVRSKGTIHWKWVDTGGWIVTYDDVLNMFNESSEFEYILNGE